jgi:hypothetical protein
MEGKNSRKRKEKLDWVVKIGWARLGGGKSGDPSKQDTG